MARARGRSIPSKPIQLVVTAAAGGANDLVARAVAERLSESMRQPVMRPAQGPAQRTKRARQHLLPNVEIDGAEVSSCSPQ